MGNATNIGVDMSLKILRLFTEKKNRYRKELRKPFSYGAFSFATDGRIIVRLKRCDGANGSFSKASVAAAYFRQFPKRGFVKIDIPNKADVPKNDHGFRVVAIAHRHFDMQFLTPLKRLPKLKVGVNIDRLAERKRSYFKFGPMPFIFDGGCGWVMPNLGNSTYRIKLRKVK